MDKLTMDSIAAQRAGMSYGKYKALHPITCTTSVEIIPPEPPKSGPVTVFRCCARCGKMFEVIARTRKRYCGPECAAAAAENKRKECTKRKRAADKEEKLQAGKICPVCGKRFFPADLRIKICSQECKVKSHRQAQKAYYSKNDPW